MSEQYDKPVVPRFGVGPDGKLAEPPRGPEDPGTIAAGSGEPAVPRYWTAGDREPAASRPEFTAGDVETDSERWPDDSVIVIKPEDIMSPADAEADRSGSGPRTRTQQLPKDDIVVVDSAYEAEPAGAGAGTGDVEDSRVEAGVDEPEPVPNDAAVPEPGVPEPEVPQPEVPEPVVVVAEAQPEVAEVPAAGVRGTRGGRGRGPQQSGALVSFADDERWHGVMVGFIDDPQASVEAAAALVGEEVAGYVALLSERQEALREPWRGDQDTDALRMALQSYRDFRKRLAEVGSTLLAGPS